MSHHPLPASASSPRPTHRSPLGALPSLETGNRDGFFAIDPSSGQLSVALAAVNYEQSSWYDLGVRATDPNGLLADTVVRVLVTDMNDSPTFPDASRIVNENAFATTAVGGVLVVQDEDSLQTHSFAITTGNDAAIFTWTRPAGS